MRGLLIVLMLSFAPISYAQDMDAKRLAQGCNELIGIYKNKNEKRLLASQLVSSSDAMLAGYCMGVTTLISNFGLNECRGRNWYELAEVIASTWKLTKHKVSVDRVLRSICHG